MIRRFILKIPQPHRQFFSILAVYCPANANFTADSHCFHCRRRKGSISRRLGLCSSVHGSSRISGFHIIYLPSGCWLKGRHVDSAINLSRWALLVPIHTMTEIVKCKTMHKKTNGGNQRDVIYTYWRWTIGTCVFCNCFNNFFMKTLKIIEKYRCIIYKVIQ